MELNETWKMLRHLALRGLGLGAVLVQYGCIAHCTLEYVADFVVCSGPSMQPTISSSDVVLTEHISVGRGNISRGDVVIARSPTNPHQHICKRVTRIEGDWIENPPPGFSRKYVPRGHVWLEGDNAINSTDSRSYGPVPYALLRSRVFYKIWPLTDIGKVQGKEKRWHQNHL